MSVLKSRRPRTPEEFIAGAELSESPAAMTSSPAADLASSPPSAGPRSRSDAAAPPDDGEFPWEAAWVRPEVVKLFNLRLPEPYKLKLD
jgi:hypothetical protein